MDNEVVGMALRMIGKNIMIIADCIHKDEDAAAAEEKPKKKTRKTAKADPKAETVIDTVEDEMAAEKPKVTFELVRAALAKKARLGYSDAVRNLVGNFGVEKLSEIKPEHYAEILEQAELIGYE